MGNQNSLPTSFLYSWKVNQSIALNVCDDAVTLQEIGCLKLCAFFFQFQFTQLLSFIWTKKLKVKVSWNIFLLVYAGRYTKPETDVIFTQN